MYRKILYLAFLFTALFLFQKRIYASTGDKVDSSDSKVSLIIETQTPYGVLKSEVHFLKKYLNLALRVKEIQENDLIKLVNYFEYVPRDTIHFNIDGDFLVANGNATIFPTNIINLYTFPPKGSEHLTVFTDWWRSLVVHEFTHIIHLDQTRGFVEDGRKIFGTIAKVIPGVTPRWFTEGIATYFESTVLTRGRLQNELLNFELNQYLKNKKNCQKIDCLDEPGVKPHGQLAYWIGAHFVKYIEEKKPKTIKCLVEKNSQKFPFFLADVFQDCFDEDIHKVFEDFIRTYKIQITNKESLSEEFPELQLIDWQKGSFIDQNRWYFVLRKNKEELLARFDLENNVLFTKKINVKIAHLIQLIKNQTDELEDSEVEDKLLIAVHTDPFFKNHNMSFQIFGADSLSFEQKLSDFDSSFWAYKVSDREWLKITREDSSVKVILGEYDWNKFQSNSELTLDQNKLYKRLVHFQNRWFVEVYDYKTEKTYWIQKANNNWELAEINLVENENQIKKLNLKEIELTKDGEIFQKKEMVNEESTILNSLSFAPYFFEMKSENAEVINYPRLDHYQPHFWFLSFGNGDNVSAIGAMSSISDPLKDHSLDASIVSYESSKLGGDFNLQSSLEGLNFQFLLNKFYYKKDTDDLRLNNESNSLLSVSREYYFDRFRFIPRLTLSKNWQSDFISKRSSESLSGFGYLSFVNSGYLNFFQNGNFAFKTALTKSHTGKSYAELLTKTDFTFNVFEDYQIKLYNGYGKLDKAGFTDGVLFAGGVSQMNVSRWFEFYGLAYGNAYGNEVLNFRFLNDFNFFNIYQGYRLWPVFLKEWHMVFGADYLKADRIFHKSVYFYHQDIYSVFLGSKLKTNLFYYVPVDIDLILAKVFDRRKVSSQHVLLNILSDGF